MFFTLRFTEVKPAIKIQKCSTQQRLGLIPSVGLVGGGLAEEHIQSILFHFIGVFFGEGGGALFVQTPWLPAGKKLPVFKASGTL